MPSTGTTSPLRITQPVARLDRRQMPPLPACRPGSAGRCAARGRAAPSSRGVRGARQSSRDIARRHTSPRRRRRRDIRQTASAASIESAAMTSRPTSPRRKLTTISIRRTTRTGTVATAHIRPSQCCQPDSCIARPRRRPVAGHMTMTGGSNVRGSGKASRPDATGSSRVSMCSGRPNGPQIKNKSAGIFTGKSKHRHIGMPIIRPPRNRSMKESSSSR